MGQSGPQMVGCSAFAKPRHLLRDRLAPRSDSHEPKWQVPSSLKWRLWVTLRRPQPQPQRVLQAIAYLPTQG